MRVYYVIYIFTAQNKRRAVCTARPSLSVTWLTNHSTTLYTKKTSKNIFRPRIIEPIFNFSWQHFKANLIHSYLAVFFFFLSVFFVSFVQSTLNDPEIFVCFHWKWFALDIFSVFTACGEAAAFLFLLFKLSWINCLQTDRQRHSSIIVSVICIALFLLFNLDYSEWHKQKDQFNKILLLSEKQYIQISEGKNLTWDRDWH